MEMGGIAPTLRRLPVASLRAGVGASGALHGASSSLSVGAQTRSMSPQRKNHPEGWF